MTSRLEDSHYGGANEDEEADESSRDEEARSRDESEYEKANLQDETKSIGEQADAPLDAEAQSQDDFLDALEGGEDDRLDQDYAQLGRDDASTPDAASSALLNEGSTNQVIRSRDESVIESGSIPDDTPSIQGSLASTPGELAYASPRRSLASRKQSGALQPFERRFEARPSASRSPSSRAASPAFLSPHSRQISLSSQVSYVSSDADADPAGTPQAPWEVVRWTKLHKITAQAFSEAGKRSFGRPTCLAASALIAIGTSKGLVLGFDYHQTLKIIIGQGTKATECGSVTALAIAADYSTIASGHANGHVFTWEISRPSQPFLRIPPIDRASLEHPKHPDGHVANTAVLHIGFLGTRHTALVSADAGGMAFSHLATRGLGPVTRTVKTSRLLGRYPSAREDADRSRKPSSVLAFSPLPLGNVEQASDGIGLTALLTPYLLVIVSTTPVAQTQYKAPRPKELLPHGTLSGCLAWFPAVKLKKPASGSDKVASDAKLAYCWSNVLAVLEVKIVEAEDGADSNKPPSLAFSVRSRWRAEEAIVAVQWLGRSVLGVLTVSQRLLIIEDGTLRVTDSVDLLNRHIYHQDLFSQQLKAVVETLNSAEPSLHGVVADAFYMSFRAHKGRTFLLGFDDITVGTLSNWADRLVALMGIGDCIAAIKLATDYYAGSANNVTVGLPDADATRHSMVKERLTGMVSASLNYTFAQHDDARESRLSELACACFDACIAMQETDYLFGDIFELFDEADETSVFITTLEPYVLEGEVNVLPPDLVQSLVAHFIGENQTKKLEELLCRLEPHSFDLDQVTTLCRQHGLYDALIYVWTQGIGDFVTPLIDLLALIKLLQDGGEDEDLSDNPFFASAMKVFSYLAYSLSSRSYPSGELVDGTFVESAKTDIYNYLFSGTPTAWPPGSHQIFRTTAHAETEPAFPYLVLLLRFDASDFMSMLNEAFEDSFLNGHDDDHSPNGALTNGANGRTGLKMTREQIVYILLDVMKQEGFEQDDPIYLDMFIARSLPKYPGQLVLSGSLSEKVLHDLCNPPLEELREDCQLSVEFLLSSYRPPDEASLIQALKRARFFRVLKSTYRRARMFTELIEVYFEDPDDKAGVFECVALCIRPSTGLGQKQLEDIKHRIVAHFEDLAGISTVLTAKALAAYAPDLLQQFVNALDNSYQQFTCLRTLLEPQRLTERGDRSTAKLLDEDQLANFAEQYVQLMCKHDPQHVADYIGLLPTSNLKLDAVLPAMESSGVVDAAVVLLAREGMARDAMDRLVTHLQSLQQALIGLIEASLDSPDVAATQEAATDIAAEIEKYTKVGIWLCQGQSAHAERRHRPRSSLTLAINEDDLDLDEFLWLNLADVVVQMARNVSISLEYIDDHPTESDNDGIDSAKLTSLVRTNVQQTFTALLAATSASSKLDKPSRAQLPQRRQDTLSFPRILRAFLSRAASTAPSLPALRAVLSDIFAAYTFEEGVLSLANGLLGSDVFADMQAAHAERQRGWRPRTAVCDRCKRRVWGPGVDGVAWDAWVAKEQERDADRLRARLERSGDKGKAKSPVAGGGDGSDDDETARRRLALVVFACRHVFHRACLDEEFRDGRPSITEPYSCSVCAEQKARAATATATTISGTE